MLKTLVFVGIGSFLGGIFRFLLSRFIVFHFPHTFPLGTFLVNLTGCLAIGIFYGLFEKGHLLNAELRLFLIVGLCGGFTTFSAFINENFLLLREQYFFYFALYTGLSIILGLLATYAGYQLIRQF